jgi:hypothetical protein
MSWEGEELTASESGEKLDLRKRFSYVCLKEKRVRIQRWSRGKAIIDLLVSTSQRDEEGLGDNGDVFDTPFLAIYA